MKRLAIGALLFATACGSGIDQKSKDPVVVISDSGNNNGGSDMGMSDAGNSTDMNVMVPDATSTPGGPKIIDFTANVMRLTQGESVTLSALVTDDDGVDDIIGGRVLGGEAVFGNFQGSGGSYEYSLSWDTIDQVAPINFDAQSTLVLTAEFVDAAGNRGTQSLTLTLHCEGDPACEGQCSTLQCQGACQDAEFFLFSDDNCGGCGNVCGAGEFCEGGGCFCELGETCNGVCTNTDVDRNNCGTCGNVCGADEGCRDGFCESGVAGAMGPCESDEDCPSGGICIQEITGGLCFVQCETSATCGPGEECLTSADFPLGGACAPLCSSNADCRPELECQQSVEGPMACGPVLGN